MNAVNTEANDPTACIAGTVAFIRGPEFVTVRNTSGAYHIVQVLVVGFLTEAGFQAATPTPSFSVESVDERIACELHGNSTFQLSSLSLPGGNQG